MEELISFHLTDEKIEACERWNKLPKTELVSGRDHLLSLRYVN